MRGACLRRVLTCLGIGLGYKSEGDETVWRNYFALIWPVLPQKIVL